MSMTRAVSQSSPGPGRLIFARLLPGDDLMEGIRQVCKREGIYSGVILCCMGSLARTHFEYGRVSKDPTNEVPIIIDEPTSLLACQGIISSDGEGGEIYVHLHGSVQTNDRVVQGQHFADHGNIVFNLVELVVADVQIELVRAHDPEINAPITMTKAEAIALGA